MSPGWQCTRRRAAMTEPSQPMVKIYGTRGSATCYALRDFLQRSDVPFEWTDLTSGEAAGAEAGGRGPDDPSLPVCVFSDGTPLTNSSVRQITKKLGWFRPPPPAQNIPALF